MLLKNHPSITSFLFGLLIALTFLLYNLPIAGIGITFFLLLLLLLYAIQIIFKDRHIRISMPIGLKRIFLYQIIFNITLGTCFWINGSMSSGDIKYLLSIAANILWLPIFYILGKGKSVFIFHSYRYGFIIISYLITVLWICLVFYTKDLFFLRNVTLLIEPLKYTILQNPNRCGRMLLVIMMVIYFYYLYEKNTKRYLSQRHLIGIIYVLSGIIISSLSRINILSLFVIVFLALGIQKMDRIRLRRIIFSIIVTALLFILVVAIVPELDQRFVDGLIRIDNFFSSLYVQDPTSVQGRRVRMWLATLNIIREYPVFGVGFSRIETYLKFFGSILIGGLSPGDVIDVHGGLIKIIAYGGLLSFISFLIYYEAMIKYSFSYFFKGKNIRNKHAAYSSLILLLALIPINLFADNLSLSLTWMSISFLLVNIELDIANVSEKNDQAKIR